MRRALVLGALALAACGEDPPAAPAQARFESVESTTGDVDQVLRDVCDVVHPASSAPEWEWPATTSAPERHPGKWTWVNVWATWCHPCLEEMPLLQRSLGADGPIGVSFLSADANDDELASFRRERSFTAISPRLTDPTAVGTLVSRYGFRGVSSLPVHVLVDPQDKVRCVRAGLVEARHVEQILTALGRSTAPRIR